MTTSITLRGNKGSALTYVEVDDNFSNLKTTADAAKTTADAAAVAGAVTSSGLTMATGKLLGRSSASTGAVQEIIVGAGLALSGGQLEANLGAYLTSADAAATYQPITSMSGYLTSATAASTYQTQAGMSAYLTTTTAASTYQTQAGMSSYLTTVTASSTYLTQTNAASTYQTQSGMSSYLTTATASSTYAPLASPTLTGVPAAPTAAVDTNTTQIATTAYVIGQGYLKSSTAASTYQTQNGMSSYLTTASASSTYLTQTNAASTYQTQAGMSSYLTTASAASTYQTQSGMSSYLTTSAAASTYLALSGGTLTGTLSTKSVDVTTNFYGSITAVSASAIDCSLGNYFTKTASGALTWTITNVPSSRSFSFILRLTNGGTGTQTWPASVKWPGGTAPTLTASGVDVLGFITEDGGTTWRGVALMTDSK